MKNCLCGASGGRPFTVAERQLGLGNEFTYLECESCGSLRIGTIPTNLELYYPQNYYSFVTSPRGWRERLQRGAMAFALCSQIPHLSPLYFHWASVVQSMGVSYADRILDVGSGTNGMAANLRSANHRKALGIDPFILEDVYDENGLALKKAYLSETGGEWDVVAFNHSLEHMADPVEGLTIAKSLLSAKGRIIVRIPIAAYAYREYGSFWFQIDAPRHLFIPTERGMSLLSERVGMNISKVVYDSNFKQFWHSERYRQGISLLSVAPRYWEMITRSVNRNMTKKAKKLNQERQGDQAVFVLTRRD